MAETPQGIVARARMGRQSWDEERTAQVERELEGQVRVVAS